MSSALSMSPLEIHIERVRPELSAALARDRALWQRRQAASAEFREARLRLGAALLRATRGMHAQSIGKLYRAIGVNRHTAHHAMRLALEFCDAEGRLDQDKLAAARRRGAGILRQTRAGQAALETELSAMTLRQLRRVMAASRRAEQEASGTVDHGQQTREYGQAGPIPPDDVPNMRPNGGSGGAHRLEAGATVGGLESPPPCDGVGAAESPLRPCGAGLAPAPGAAPLADRAGDRVGNLVGVRRGLTGEQMVFDFEAAARRTLTHIAQVLDSLAAIDPSRLAAFEEPLEVLDELALSLLREGVA